MSSFVNIIVTEILIPDVDKIGNVILRKLDVISQEKLLFTDEAGQVSEAIAYVCFDKKSRSFYVIPIDTDGLLIKSYHNVHWKINEHGNSRQKDGEERGSQIRSDNP